MLNNFIYAVNNLTTLEEIKQYDYKSGSRKTNI